MNASMESIAEAWISANLHNYVIDAQASQLPKQEITQYLFDHAIKSPQIDQTSSNDKPLQLSNTATSLLGVKTISIRCLVEQEVSMTTTTLSDCQVFLPGSLLFLDIVRAALVKLGFAVSETIAAKGSIQVKNWNAVEVEKLSDDPSATLDQMLAHVAAICTLRIKLNRLQLEQIEWDEQAVRSAVLKLLKNHNQVHLSRICPIPQSMISNIANSKYTTRLCAEKCREFGVWFAEYHNNIAANIVEYQPSSSRLTFHPMYELPLLRKWYQQCPSPTTEELKKFLVELNMAPVRQERDKVPLRRLRVWWRNEKQRLKRYEKEGIKLDAMGRKKRKRRKKKMNIQQQLDLQTTTQDDNQVFINADNNVACQEHNEADNQEYNEVDNQEYNETDKQGYNETDNQGYNETDNQGYNETDNQGYNETDNQGYNETDNQGYNETDNQGYSETNNQAYRETDSQEQNEQDNQEYKETNNQEHDDPPINLSEPEYPPPAHNLMTSPLQTSMFNGGIFQS